MLQTLGARKRLCLEEIEQVSKGAICRCGNEAFFTGGLQADCFGNVEIHHLGRVIVVVESPGGKVLRAEL